MLRAGLVCTLLLSVLVTIISAAPVTPLCGGGVTAFATLPECRITPDDFMDDNDNLWSREDVLSPELERRGLFSKIGHAIKHAAHSVTHAVTHPIQTVVHTVKHVAHAVTHPIATIKHAVSTVHHAVKRVASTVHHAIKHVAHAVTHPIATVKHAVSTVHHTIKRVGSAVHHAVKRVASKVHHAVKRVASKVHHAVKRVASTVHHVVKGAVKGVKKAVHFIKKNGPTIAKIGLKMLASSQGIMATASKFIPGVGIPMSKALKMEAKGLDMASGMIHAKVPKGWQTAMNVMSVAEDPIGHGLKKAGLHGAVGAAASMILG